MVEKKFKKSSFLIWLMIVEFKSWDDVWRYLVYLNNNAEVKERPVSWLGYRVFETTMFKNVFGEPLMKEFLAFLASTSLDASKVVGSVKRLEGTIYEIIADQDGYIIDGASRAMALIALGKESVLVKVLPIRCTESPVNMSLCVLYAINVWFSKGESPVLTSISEKALRVVSERFGLPSITLSTFLNIPLPTYKSPAMYAPKRVYPTTTVVELVQSFADKLGLNEELRKLALYYAQQWLNKNPNFQKSVVAAAAILAALHATCVGKAYQNAVKKYLFSEGLLENMTAVDTVMKKMVRELGVTYASVKSACKERLKKVLVDWGMKDKVEDATSLFDKATSSVGTPNLPAISAVIAYYYGIVTNHPISQNEISQWFGITEQTLRATLKELRHLNLIQSTALPQQSPIDRSREPS